MLDSRGKHGNHARSSDAGRWNNGQLLTSHGYVKVRVGVSHPLADTNGYAYEHTIVVISAGLPVKKGQIIHHINGVKTDNRLENLQVMNRGEHWHGRGRDPSNGQFIKAAGRRLAGVEHLNFPEVANAPV